MNFEEIKKISEQVLNNNEVKIETYEATLISILTKYQEALRILRRNQSKEYRRGNSGNGKTISRILQKEDSRIKKIDRV